MQEDGAELRGAAEDSEAEQRVDDVDVVVDDDFDVASPNTSFSTSSSSSSSSLGWRPWILFREWVVTLSLRAWLALIGAVVLSIGIGVGLWLLVRLGVAAQFVEWAHSLGRPYAALLMFGLLFFASTPVTSFAGVLTIVTGYLLGFPLALAVAMSGILAGGCVTFLVSRYVFRARAERYIDSSAVWRRINARIEHSHAGWRIALLLRLAGIPVGVLNVLLAVSKLPFLTFVWTMIGEMRRVFVNAFLGSGLLTVQQAVEGQYLWTPLDIVVFVVGAVVAVAAITAGVYFAKKMLDDAVNDETDNDSGIETEAATSVDFEDNP